MAGGLRVIRCLPNHFPLPLPRLHPGASAVAVGAVAAVAVVEVLLLLLLLLLPWIAPGRLLPDIVCSASSRGQLFCRDLAGWQFGGKNVLKISCIKSNPFCSAEFVICHICPLLFFAFSRFRLRCVQPIDPGNSSALPDLDLCQQQSPAGYSQANLFAG